jgi:hypothetical protein
MYMTYADTAPSKVDPLDYFQLEELKEKGYCILKDADFDVPEEEFITMEYMDWKSGGDTNFAPIASALGEMECAGFWEHGKPDKDGAWTQNAQLCPTLVNYVESMNANYGRVRTIKLNPQDYDQAFTQIHLDDNNRLNKPGEGWVVRTWLELTETPGAAMILRTEKEDADSEVRLELHKGMRYVVDSERMWHVVMNPTDQPRYSLITSVESSPQLSEWIQANS